MNQFIDLVTEMSPYLLLGFLLAGLMHAFIPGTIYSKYLAKPNMRSVVLAALFGIPLPLCSCGVLPTAMSLRREGASKGAAVSFLIATPQTGVDSIIATFSLMGLPFAIIRPIAALATAIFGGKKSLKPCAMPISTWWRAWEATPVGHIRAEVCVSDDRQFLALNILRFSNFEYVPVGGPRLFRGHDAKVASRLFKAG